MNTRFTGSTRDPAVNITTWIVLSSVILAVFTRLGIKLRLFNRLADDDFLMVTSLVVCILQSICVSMAVANGYGKHIEEVSNAEFDIIMKYIYAGTLLHIVCMCLSKLSLAAFIRNLSPWSSNELGALSTEIIILAWAIIALLGTSFQCSLPHTWDIWNGKCFDLVAWQYYVGISSILTDLLIFIRGLLLVFRVQASLAKRLLFATVFLPRILVVAGLITELALTRKAMETHDPTYDICSKTISQAIVQGLSIITGCWGQLKPFLAWLQSNGLRVHHAAYTTPYSSKSKSTAPSHIQFSSRDRWHYDETMDVSTCPQDQILVRREVELKSQSSAVPIIQEHDLLEDNDPR